MAKIKRLVDLPNWFDFDHYSSVSKFRAVEWNKALSQRKFLFDILKGRAEKNPDLARAYCEAFPRLIKGMRGIPVEDTDIDGFFGEHGYEQTLADECRGVVPLTFRHLYEHASIASAIDGDGGVGGPAESWFEQMVSITSENVHTSVTVDPPLFLNHALRLDETLAAFRVDLQIPTAQLLKAFKSTLLQAKKSKQKSLKTKKYYQPNFKDLTRYGLLPYLDLKIWEMETGHSITDSLMALAVTRHRDEDHLRTSTKKWAKKLMEGDLGPLREQAAAELIERHRKSGKPTP